MKKLLVVGNTLNMGGAEKSLVAFVNHIDYDKCDVTLKVFSGGPLAEEITNRVKIEYINKPPDRQDGIVSILQYCFHSPVYPISLLKFYIGLHKTRLHNMEYYWKELSRYYRTEADIFDIAIAYGQGIATYYVRDKVHADVKTAVVNTDFSKAGYHKEMENYDSFSAIGIDSQQGFNTFVNMFPEYTNRAFLIQNLIDQKTIKELSRTRDHFFHKNKFNILTVARLVEMKGFDYVIEASRILKNKGMDFVWNVVGEGEYRKKIEKDITKYGLSEQLHLWGQQSNPYPFFAECDLFVHPSKFEGFGMVIREALMLGCVTVSTNFPAAYDQIKDGETGTIVEMSGASLAEAIISYYSSREKYNTIKKNVCNMTFSLSEDLKAYRKLLGECDE